MCGYAADALASQSHHDEEELDEEVPNYAFASRGSMMPVPCEKLAQHSFHAAEAYQIIKARTRGPGCAAPLTHNFQPSAPNSSTLRRTCASWTRTRA